MSNAINIAGSFRDPSGFLYHRDETLYRQINKSYQSQYQQLMDSGLYQTLVKDSLIVSHRECDITLAASEQAFKVIQPERLPYISYPYEWSFSQIKDAALLTLKIQLVALKYNMILKDASAYNVQFHQGRPIFIDSLSFEHYKGGPWVAYKQFCQHFFAPLCMLSYTDHRLSQLYRIYIDGPPLDLVSKLLPKKTWLKYSILAHVHIHARSQQYYANSADQDASTNSRALKVTKDHVSAIAQQLESAIAKLQIGVSKTEWGDYYQNTNYRDASLDA